MAIRKIRTLGDEVLRKISKPVEKIDQRILTLIEDMVDTMYEANGVGLAAPQVGILKRVIVVDIGEGLYKLINPEIIYEEGEQIDEEACLSIPNRSGFVKRPKKIKVKALNEKGKEVIIEAEDFFARALCHEIDHLNGVLYIDRLETQEVMK
ncbi:peptide deformylase [Caloramator fervidus]|uniref:Peptide deformylase n=1 Tax=Caloramator fervidus TaxID=29344 RepID=A0A1H5TYS2_9CLOT|nr:peptide deformylase [Caloramator fervidus]SEF67956.1 peptide deformylase [Caloramator fervidus]